MRKGLGVAPARDARPTLGTSILVIAGLSLLSWVMLIWMVQEAWSSL
jgi:hypothetical protein